MRKLTIINSKAIYLIAIEIQRATVISIFFSSFILGHTLNKILHFSALAENLTDFSAYVQFFQSSHFPSVS